MGEPAFTITATLFGDERTTVYRAVRCADRRPAILKVLGPRPPQPRDLERLRNELEIGRALAGRGVVRPLALESFAGMPALVFEDFAGVSLDRMLGRPMATEQFLRLASAVAGALALLHQSGVVHKDVKPENILVDPATGEVRLTDLGLAARISRGLQPSRHTELIEGTLPFISPEQTGRMNRAIDQRSDLYSLGVTFFVMLTGRLPFTAHDPLEWVHAHVARPAPSARAVVPEVPEPLAAIVARLLEKMPEGRYQTASGLAHDLERARRSFDATGLIEPFPLGEADLPDRLQNPQRLYGRAAQLVGLQEPLAAMMATGRPALVLVSGYAGVGKSSLVYELLRASQGTRGRFLTGKFDRFQRNVPYATLSQAFRSVFQDLLGGSEERLAAWRARIAAALGANGRLIVDVIPELELVLGPLPPVAPLPPIEAEQRLHAVFHAFITAFATPEHPVVFFFDDLQWADVASLKLLQRLLTTPDTRHLLVIGAYRDNEVDREHPLTAAIRTIRAAGVRVDEFVLGPLSVDDLTTLAVDTVHRPRDEVRPLAELLHLKTGGNPFFVIQFLNELVDEGLLVFDAGARRWRWDLERIRGKGYTDNVVAFMVGRIGRLPRRSREALCLAACAGAVSDLRALALAGGASEEALRRDLAAALEEGLLVAIPRGFRFAHDRVQQAAYSLVREDERRRLHLRIGRAMLECTPADAIAEQVFEIVNQLNLGRDGLDTPAERRRVAELDLLAGRKATAAAAYASAANYFAAGASLLPEDAWETAHGLAFSLWLERARSEFLAGAVDEAERLLDVVRARARDASEAAAVATSEIYLRTVLGQMQRAVGVALAWLRRHTGVALSLHPTVDEVLAHDDALRREIGARKIEELLDLPRLESAEVATVLDLLVASMPPALFTDANLLAILAMYAARLSVQHGNGDASASAYLVVAMALTQRFGRYREAYAFAELGRDLVEQRHLVSHRSKVYLDFALINHWTHPLRTNRELLRRAFDDAVEVGKLPIACYACNNRITLLLALGAPLPEVQQDCEASLAFVRRARYGLVEAIITSQLRLVLALRGATSDLSCFDDDEFDERAFLARLEQDRGSMAIALCWHFIRRMQAHFFAGAHEEALAAARRAEELLWTSESFMEIPEFHFYKALTLASVHDARGGDERAAVVAELAEECERFAVWAENCPENFGHKHALIAAELARVRGDQPTAMRRYEQAIREAHGEGFVQNEAIAYELAARAYRARDFPAIADLYLQEARLRYMSWGAEAKVAQLERLHPPLAQPRLQVASRTLAVPVAQLELIAVVKASQAISKEVTWDRLARRLLEVSLEQGGADRGCLIRVEDGQLVVAADARVDEQNVRTELLPSVPLVGSALAPTSVVQFVRRSQERVMLDDAAQGGSFARDEYFVDRRPRSLLCLPILRQAEVCAVLYLENDRLAGAFTVERLTVLELIAAQGAIALENVQLFTRLERENGERRRAEAFLEESRARLQQIIDNTTALICLKDPEGRYLLVNRRFAELLCREVDAFDGKTDYDLFSREQADLFRASDLAVLRVNRALEFEEMVDLGDGPHTYISLKFPLSDATGRTYAVGFIATDISARKRDELRLRSSLSLLEATFESTADGLLVVDLEGRTLQLNRKLTEMLPIPAETLLRRGHEHLALGAGLVCEPEEYLARIRWLLAHPDQASLDIFELKDGRIFERYSLPQRLDDRVVGRLWSFRDVTTRARAERERDRALLDERRSRAEAEEAVRLRDEFLLVASHELRTPLTSLQLAIERLTRQLRDDAAPAVKRALEVCLRQTQRMGGLVEVLLDVGRIRAGSLELNRRPVDLGALVEDVMSQLAEPLARSGSALIVHVTEPVVGSWDGARLEQVVTNLLSNALKFGEGRPIELRVERSRDTARLTVTDQGIGIPPDAQARIFERFGRAVSPHHYGGLGLGLFIVRAIVEAHGGRIDVVSAPGRGSTFTVELPLAG